MCQLLFCTGIGTHFCVVKFNENAAREVLAVASKFGRVNFVHNETVNKIYMIRPSLVFKLIEMLS